MARVKARSGFTLVEAVLSLFILLSISILIQLTLQTSRHYRFDDLTPTSDWFLFIEELESQRHAFALMRVEHDRLFLVDRANNEHYELVSGKCLYLRGRQGGYMPILLNYHPGTVTYQQIDSRRVKIEAQTKDKKIHKAVAIFSPTRKRDASQYHDIDGAQRSHSVEPTQSTKTKKC